MFKGLRVQGWTLKLQHEYVRIVWSKIYRLPTNVMSGCRLPMTSWRRPSQKPPDSHSHVTSHSHVRPQPLWPPVGLGPLPPQAPPVTSYLAIYASIIIYSKLCSHIQTYSNPTHVSICATNKLQTNHRQDFFPDVCAGLTSETLTGSKASTKAKPTKRRP